MFLFNYQLSSLLYQINLYPPSSCHSGNISLHHVTNILLFSFFIIYRKLFNRPRFLCARVACCTATTVATLAARTPARRIRTWSNTKPSTLKTHLNKKSIVVISFLYFTRCCADSRRGRNNNKNKKMVKILRNWWYFEYRFLILVVTLKFEPEFLDSSRDFCFSS